MLPVRDHLRPQGANISLSHAYCRYSQLIQCTRTSELGSIYGIV